MMQLLAEMPMLADYTVHDIHWQIKVLIGLWLFGKLLNWVDVYSRREGYRRPGP